MNDVSVNVVIFQFSFKVSMTELSASKKVCELLLQSKTTPVLLRVSRWMTLIMKVQAETETFRRTYQKTERSVAV